MKTNREIISTVRSMLKSVNIDDRLPSAFIYSKIMDVATLIIKRESETRRIFNSGELFKKIECVEMIDVPSKSCSSLPIPCKNLKRSKIKIPEAFLSSSGSIMYVTAINSSEKLYQTNIDKYIDIAKREFKSKNIFYWISDGYLWIPDSNIKFIDVYILAKDNSEVDKANGVKCSRFLDSTTSIPDWMLEDVLRVVIEQIGNITKRIPADENSDLNEHSKT